MPNNAVILFITDTDRILLVRDRKDQQWMLPGGRVNQGERSRAAAFREFHEETTFHIDKRFIITEERADITHKNGSKTAIFIIRSSQRFPPIFPGTNETDSLYYIKIDDFINLVERGTRHHTVTRLKPYVMRSSHYLIRQGLIIAGGPAQPPIVAPAQPPVRGPAQPPVRGPPIQRLYLTYGDNRPTDPWGGFHITICGENFTRPISDALKTNFYRKGNSWTFSSTTKYNIKRVHGIWTIVFQSQTIDDLSQELISLGFTNVKGPLSRKRTPWHVSLNRLSEVQAHQKAAEFITHTTFRPKWFLTLCEDDANGTYTWTPLQSLAGGVAVRPVAGGVKQLQELICRSCFNNQSRKCKVHICYCGYCNHCHAGGWCPDGRFWYKQRENGKPDSRVRIRKGESHGGHSWIPDCNQH